MRFKRTSLVASIFLLAAILPAPIASATDDSSFFGDLKADSIMVVGESWLIKECWDSPVSASLKFKIKGTWKTVANAKKASKSSQCRDGGYLSKWNFKFNFPLPPKNSSGKRWMSVAESTNNGVTYYTKVQVMTRAEWDAKNAPESGSPSASPPTLVPSTPVSAPSEPTYVAASAPSSRGELSVIWQPPAKTGGSAVTYEIRVNGNPVKSGIVENSYTLTGLADATTYSISVYAQNASGLSNPTTITAKTQARPLTPEEQEAAANPGKKKVTISIVGPGPVQGSRTNETGGYDSFGVTLNPSWSYWVRPNALASVNFFRSYDFEPGTVPRGTVTCEIRVNGQLVNRSSGDYLFGVTSCNASVR
jgi:hypothetical protein